MPDVILPVLNEADALPWVLDRFPGGFVPLVVDNGSTDDSARIARAAGARVVTEPVPGFGSACYAGLLAASSEVVCFMDCDGSLDPRQLAAVSAPVENGTADLVLGSRVARRGAWPLHARLSNRLLAAVVRRRTGLRITDIGPMRATRRSALVALGLKDRRFGWPLEMVLRAAEEGWSIEEVPVELGPRSGRSKVTGTLRGTLRTVLDMGKALG